MNAEHEMSKFLSKLQDAKVLEELRDSDGSRGLVTVELFLPPCPPGWVVEEKDARTFTYHKKE